MLIIYLIFIIILIIGTRIVKDNKDYLDKNMTTTINGMFVITVFFSHFLTYIENTNIYDQYLINILHFIGQLMVTSFLFYSGYGIYESIKNKPLYMKYFFRKRFIPTFLNFSFAVILYIIVNIIIGNNYSIEKILLSFTGFYSIGNSNWYMLATFIMYLFILLCFNDRLKINNNKKIILFSLLTFIYVFIITRFKDNYYADTILCFPLGIWYSYFKDRINSVLYKKYYLCLTVSLICLIITFLLVKYFYNIYIYNIYACCFIIFIVFLTRKIKINSPIISFFGIHTFWIYILERIPMIILQNKLNNYIYFSVCLILTIILSFFIKKITDKLWKKTSKGEKKYE